MILIVRMIFFDKCEIWKIIWCNILKLFGAVKTRFWLLVWWCDKKVNFCEIDKILEIETRIVYAGNKIWENFINGNFFLGILITVTPRQNQKSFFVPFFLLRKKSWKFQCYLGFYVTFSVESDSEVRFIHKMWKK